MTESILPSCVPSQPATRGVCAAAGVLGSPSRVCVCARTRGHAHGPRGREEISSATAGPGEAGEGKEALWGNSGGFLESQDRNLGPRRARSSPNKGFH